MDRRRLLASAPIAIALAATELSGCSTDSDGLKTNPNMPGLEHVVILMQENRSFDHYFGALSGVRGFNDKQCLEYPDGRSVFDQLVTDEGDGSTLGQQIMRPFRCDTTKFNAQNAEGTPHDWDTTHQMRHQGAWDRWIPAKTPFCMGYFNRQDIPFQYALADAYTICDQYFSSLFGPTTPNRLFQWTGTIDAEGRNGGPAISNPPDHQPVYRWSTYPEQLHRAGISWKTYVNNEVGNDDKNHPMVGDYGDNPLWLFQQYHDALTSHDDTERSLAIQAGLHEGWLPDSGRGHDTTHLLEGFIQDCSSGNLPRVSYIVAPYGWSEHPAGSPNHGAHYIKTIIDAINSNDTIRRTTALIINFDENDGYFDHQLPPVPEPGTPGEFVEGKPIGYGVRVPLIIVSPWTRGGWVNSQVADHTSVIRFLEEFTGVNSENISDWRRAISGNLASCFDFQHPDFTAPDLPATQGLVAEADRGRFLPTLTPPPPGIGSWPRQEAAPHRRKRPGVYLLEATLTSGDTTTVTIHNKGFNAVSLALFAQPQEEFVPEYLTVLPGQERHWQWSGDPQHYDIRIHGPDGFLRRFIAAGEQHFTVVLDSRRSPKPVLEAQVTNTSTAPITVEARAHDYVDHTEKITLEPSAKTTLSWPLDINGYYDVSFETAPDQIHRYAGRIPSPPLPP